MSKVGSKEHVRNMKVFGLPIGRFVNSRSFLPDDEISQKGIAEASEILENDDSGLALFFAHIEKLDIFGTLAVMEKVLPEFDAIFPVAGSWYHFPILNLIFKQFAKQAPYKFHPVFRKEDFGKMDLRTKVVDFSRLSDEEKIATNEHYFQESNAMLEKPGGIVVLNPYGGRSPKLEFLRKGPLKIIQSGKPILLSFTIWNKSELRYDVYFSKVLRFHKDTTLEEAHDVIYANYMRMADLSNVSEQKVLESKSGSRTGKIVWSAVALALSTYLFMSLKKAREKNKKV